MQTSPIIAFAFKVFVARQKQKKVEPRNYAL